MIKINLHDWVNNVNIVRCWLFIEANYVFLWIFSSMIFVVAAQVFKFKSSVMTDKDLHADMNVWNDRESDDFLRYIKFDFFVVNYTLTQFLNGLVYGYAAGSQHLYIDELGARDFWPTGYCILIIVVVRLN